jgi:hypothetical protein
VSDEIKTCDGCGQLTRNAAFRSCDDCEPDTETIAQLRRELEANRKGWHDCNQKLAEEYAGHCVTKRALAAEQKAHERARQALGYAAEQCSKANAKAERYREALRDLRDVFRRELPRYRLDSLGLEIERALSDEPAPKNDPWSEPCDMCHKQATWSHREQGKPPIRRCEAHRDAKSLGRLSAPTTEEEPKE